MQAPGRGGSQTTPTRACRWLPTPDCCWPLGHANRAVPTRQPQVVGQVVGVIQTYRTVTGVLSGTVDVVSDFQRTVRENIYICGVSGYGITVHIL
jgi:hypothetical protein